MFHSIQQTSLFAYQEIKLDLGNRQQAVYDALKKLGEATDQEISIYLSQPINQTTPRRGEMVKLNLIEKAGIRHQNGRPAIIWKLK